MPPSPRIPQTLRIAIVGGGMAGAACARTLRQAGHRPEVFERERQPGGRMRHVDTPFGTFDSGAQYFTVRDDRFALALAQCGAGLHKPWSANTVRVLDPHGLVAAAGLPAREQHHVGIPAMGSLVAQWLAPLAEDGALHLGREVLQVARDAQDPRRWQLRTRRAGDANAEGDADAQPLFGGYDAVLLAVPAAQTQALLAHTPAATPLARALRAVRVAPCWTLMLAFPQAVQPGLTTLGPQWNAARSTHHRIAWLARESSKPRRGSVERWTVQANPAWSQEHLRDEPARITAKLLRAFSEITGIRAEPAHAEALCWPQAQTTAPLSASGMPRSHLWDSRSKLGACGDWCLGHRVEDAFLSGLSLALAVA